MTVAETFRPPWLKDCFSQFDRDNNGALTLNEIKQFMKYICVKVDDGTVNTVFKVSKEKRRVCPPIG